jgi:hypothetical protein
MRIGPEMALQPLFAQEATAKKEVKKRKDFEKALEAVQGGFSALKASDEVPSETGEEGQQGTITVDTGDLMDVDGDDAFVVPPGVGLTLVP